MADYSDNLEIDIHEPSFVRDPYPTYERLRAECPVMRSDLYEGFWLLTRYEDVKQAATDWRAYTSSFATPIQIFARNATADTELHGQQIKQMGVVALGFGAANHDPAVFAQPERCVLDREPNHHLAFGAGVHRCLGAPVARLELEVTLEEFARRVPDYAVAPGAGVEWKTRGDRRGLNSLPVSIRKGSDL